MRLYLSLKNRLFCYAILAVTGFRGIYASMLPKSVNTNNRQLVNLKAISAAEQELLLDVTASPTFKARTLNGVTRISDYHFLLACDSGYCDAEYDWCDGCDGCGGCDGCDGCGGCDSSC